MSRLRAISWAALAVFGLGGFTARALAGTWRAECLSTPSSVLRRSVAYCTLLPPSYDTSPSRRYPVVYFLHGLGGNQQMLLQAGGLNLVEDLSERGLIGEFLIVTPQAGRSFYINSRDGKNRYEDFLLREFFPAIEKRYRIEHGRSHRGIAGISMGGYGALHLAFRHPELFTAVSVSSAALFEKLPEIRLGNNGGRVLPILGGVFGTPPDPVFWQRESPLTLARRFRPAGMKIYFDCGTEDNYGFDQGARVLDQILTKRKIPHEFHLYPGAHDWLYFAQHLPDLVEFQSHALGPARKAQIK
jgi:putative tributyrin esterase